MGEKKWTCCQGAKIEIPGDGLYPSDLFSKVVLAKEQSTGKEYASR